MLINTANTSYPIFGANRAGKASTADLSAFRPASQEDLVTIGQHADQQDRFGPDLSGAVRLMGAGIGGGVGLVGGTIGYFCGAPGWVIAAAVGAGGIIGAIALDQASK